MLYTFVVCAGHAQAQKQDQDQIAERLRIVNELCLSGKQYDLHTDAKGNIVIKKLTPGSQGSSTITKRETEGATAIYDKNWKLLPTCQRENVLKHIYGKSLNLSNKNLRVQVLKVLENLRN